MRDPMTDPGADPPAGGESAREPVHTVGPSHGLADDAPRNPLLRWIDSRTGYRALTREALDEPIPGGARWRYVFGSALMATLAIQFLTGLLLMFSYSPSATTAWGSVYYIQYEMWGGWFLRGLHHFGSQAMVVLLGLHLLQVLLAGAYRAPRELNWWFGLILMFLALGLGLTGYLLPWDQKGYWATKVATNIAGGAPLIGPYLQTVVVGGSEYGNQTLTRFYGLHVGLLPWLLVLMLVIHVALFRKHGVTHPRETRGVVETFWPRQFFLDTVGAAVVLAILVGLVLYTGGANLDAPANPSSSNYPARPEWYFLSLYQLLKLPAFAGEREILGTVVVPTALVVVLFLFPLLDKVFPHRLAHFLACAVVFAVAGGVIYLTTLAVLEDAHDLQFQAEREAADAARERAVYLAGHPDAGISPAGAGYLLREDPFYNGHDVLESRCLSCHYYDGQGHVTRLSERIPGGARRGFPTVPERFGDVPQVVANVLAAKAPNFRPERVEMHREMDVLTVYHFTGADAGGEKVEVFIHADGSQYTLVTHSVQTASDLKGFGSRDWVRGLLEDPASPAYFGTNPELQGMKTWKQGAGAKLTGAQLDQVADFVAELADVGEDETYFEWFERRYADGLEQHPGHDLFVKQCGACHFVGLPDYSFTEGGDMEAPNLFGYGSRTWLDRMIRKPGADDLYGYLPSEVQMPAFEGRLSANDLETLIRFLQGDYIAPAGAPGSAPAGRVDAAEAGVAE